MRLFELGGNMSGQDHDKGEVSDGLTDYLQQVVAGAKAHPLFASVCVLVVLALGVISIAKLSATVNLASLVVAMLVIMFALAGLLVLGAQGPVRRFLQWAASLLLVLGLGTGIFRLVKSAAPIEPVVEPQARRSGDGAGATAPSTRAPRDALPSVAEESPPAGPRAVVWEFTTESIEDDDTLASAFAVAVIDGYLCIATAGEKQTAKSSGWLASQTLIRKTDGGVWQQLANGSGIAAFVQHPKLRTLFARRQDSVLQFHPGEQAWTRIYHTPMDRGVSKLRDFSVSENQDLILRYDRGPVRLTAASSYEEMNELRPPERSKWSYALGGGHILATPSLGGIPLQFWNGSLWTRLAPRPSMLSGFALEPGGDTSGLSDGTDLFVYVGVQRKFQGRLKKPVKVTGVLRDPVADIVYVATSRGVYYATNGEVVKLPGATEALHVTALFGYKDGEILARVKDVGMYRIKRAPRAG